MDHVGVDPKSDLPHHSTRARNAGALIHTAPSNVPVVVSRLIVDDYSIATRRSRVLTDGDDLTVHHLPLERGKTSTHPVRSNVTRAWLMRITVFVRYRRSHVAHAVPQKAWVRIRHPRGANGHRHQRYKADYPRSTCHEDNVANEPTA